MPITGEQRVLLWLSAAEITADCLDALLLETGSVESIWNDYPQKGPAWFQPGACRILEKLHSQGAVDGLCERLEKLHVKLLFRDREEYPEALRNIPDPPYVLYGAGKLEALRTRKVTLIGTRTPSAYGRELAGQIAGGLARAGVCVVSGMARGIDCASHEGALRAGGCTIGVLGSGINVPYPSDNLQLMRNVAAGSGLVLSEYPLDAKPMTFHFPHRNRVLSGLSEAVVFVEGRIKSGGMLTVSSALAQGREVFATPGRVGASGSEGPHTILREGARLVTSAQDVLDDLGWNNESRTPEQSASNAPRPQGAVGKRIVAHLARETLSPDELSQALGIPSDELIAELGMLEITGFIRREAGNRFALNADAKA